MKFFFRFFFSFIVSLFIIGCAFNLPVESTPFPTSTEISLSEPTPTPGVETLTDIASTPSMDPTNDAISSVSETGPWLVIITPDGAWKINSDGTGLARIIDVPILAPQNTYAMPAPVGGFAAFITGDSRLRDLTLHILTLPRNLTLTIPLAALEFAITESSVSGNPEVEAARAIVEQTSLAWSPDGSQLAFLGVREGESSDVYTFSMDHFWSVNPQQIEEGITRWTDGPSQGITPVWSLDGRYILHAGVNSLGTGSGQNLAGVWAIDTQTGEVISVYQPENSLAETFVGWHDKYTFLVYSWTSECGNERLRMVDVLTGETKIVWEGAFNGVAYNRENGNGALLITVDQYLANCKAMFGPGMFLLLGPEYLGTQTIMSEDAFLPIWSPESNLFFARTAEHVYAIQLDSDVINVRPLDAPTPTLPSVSNWATRLAWASQLGIWTGTLNSSSVQIFSSPASLPVWSPDGENLFFIAEEGLFVAHSPEFTPQLVGEGLFGTGAFWVNP